jgi:hypothetical protein
VRTVVVAASATTLVGALWIGLVIG